MCTTRNRIVVVMNFIFPRLASWIGTTSHRAFGILDSNIKTLHLNMAFLVSA